MDRNTVIGFVLIGLLMMGMFYFNNQGNQARLAENKRLEDSMIKAQPPKDTVAMKRDSSNAAAIRIRQTAGVFADSINKPEELTTIENDVVKITFTNKGAQPQRVELKKYNTFDGKPVVILDKNIFNKISYPVNTGTRSIPTDELTFTTGDKQTTADKSTSISFSLKDTTGKEIIHRYTLHPDNYMLDFAIELKGADQLITQNLLNLKWQVATPRVEKDIHYEKQQSHICFVQEDKYDFEALGPNGNEKVLDKKVDWVSVKQQFFASALFNKNKFNSGDIKWTSPDSSTHLIAQTTADLKLNVSVVSGNAQIPLQMYFGPSDYNILKQYNNHMENMVPYGSGVFAFVKYINRHALLPVFDFIRAHVASMGIVILLLTLFIRLLTSPILYKSYVSGAKMKALKPEIDKLKEKHGEDKQAFSMDQMKLWKSAGVSPLGGCLPALLQIPIFMSLYYFFQSNISLRGQSFLWAKDLAAYDSIYNIPFAIPFYGDHVSLFTLTATLTSLLISIYSMNTTMQDNSNPVMKYMPYIFPVMLLGVFNGLPSALTWYYTISNSITLILQIVIQKYIIDHDKILAQIEENRKKPVKQNKLQEKIIAMQEANKKVQDLKAKTSKK